MRIPLVFVCIILSFALLFGSTSCADVDIPDNATDETTKAPETTGVPTTTDPEFEAYMNIDGLSDDAKAFFRAAKEKSGCSIVDRTLTVENGTITVEGRLPIDDPYTKFRAVYGEGTAEFMEYVDSVRDIGYWFINSSVLSPDPQGKIINLYGQRTYAPIEGDYFEGNDVHDLDSLRAYFETKFTDRMAEAIMKECGDGTGEMTGRPSPPIVYYDGKLYAWVGGQGLYSDSFDAEFSIKEKSADRVSIICRKRVGIFPIYRFDDYEFVFVKEGDRWLCDQLPDIWMGYKDRWIGK